MKQTAKEKLENVKMYGRKVSEFLLPDQMKFIEDAMEEYAEQFKEKSTHLIGWECPRCGTIHSPFSLQCNCPPRIFTSSTTNTNVKQEE